MNRVLCAIAALAAAGTAASANVYVFDWDDSMPVPNGSKNDAAGEIRAITTTYDDVNEIFTWELRVKDRTTNAISIVINDGPNPKGIGGSLGHVFYDGDEVYVYAYNGVGDSSWYDGSPSPSQQTPDRIASSVVDDSFVLLADKFSDGDDRVFQLTLDVSGINAHTPLYPSSDPWDGIQFSDSVGIWLATWDGYSRTDAGRDGYLKKWWHRKRGWYDTTYAPTVPAPGAAATLGLAGLLAARRRR